MMAVFFVRGLLFMIPARSFLKQQFPVLTIYFIHIPISVPIQPRLLVIPDITIISIRAYDIFQGLERSESGRKTSWNAFYPHLSSTDAPPHRKPTFI